MRAAESTAPLTVILEDDAIALYMNPPRFPELPSDLDVLYLHHFAQYLPKPWELWQLLRPFNVYPLDDVLLSHRHTLHRAAMPASAYVVTRQGARKLLSIFNELGLFFQWDSVMLRHSISPSVLKELLPFINSDQRYFYRGQRAENASAMMAPVSLNAYAIYPPLFLHDHEGDSVRKAVPDDGYESSD